MSSLAIDHFLRFCVDSNIDHRNTADSLRKYLLAYQRNILHRGAFAALFEKGGVGSAPPAAAAPSAADTGEEVITTKPTSSYINWEYVERSLPRLDCAHWISVFSYIDFSLVTRDKSMLQSIDRHLKTLQLDEHHLACQVFLLKNTNFITAQLGVERLLCEYEVPDAYTRSLQFFAMSADSAFDITETTAVFCHIMRNCTIREAELEKQIQFVGLREEELSASFRMKQIRMVGGRPRLRSKLTDIQRDSRSVFDMYTFLSWGQAIRFPNVFSHHTKQKLYFLMSQVHIPDVLEHVHNLTRDSYVCNALKTAKVQKPEHDVLHRVIASMKLVEEPFKELQDFRCECMNAFPVTQLNAVRLNDMLHLYVCAYQNPAVWKDIWKLLIPLLSHQVIRDVETFVQRRGFNYAAVLAILNSN
jgi:hypothetical protein